MNEAAKAEHGREYQSKELLLHLVTERPNSYEPSLL